MIFNVEKNFLEGNETMIIYKDYRKCEEKILKHQKNFTMNLYIPNDESEIINDRKRLKALTVQKCDDYFEFNGNYFPRKVCQYKIGLMYLLDITNKEITYEIYTDGKYIYEETKSFDEMINFTFSNDSFNLR